MIFFYVFIKKVAFFMEKNVILHRLLKNKICIEIRKTRFNNPTINQLNFNHMRKFFTFCIVFLAMSICATAQTNLISESFDGGVLPTGWTAIDADGDTYNWDATYWNDNTGNAGYGHTGAGCIASASYINSIGALTPNNWLISPSIAIPSQGATLSFWVRVYGYPEPIEVLVSTTGNAVANFTGAALLSQTITSDTYTEYTVNLSAYAGQNIYIAFAHRNVTDQYWLMLDDVTVFANPTGPTIVANPTTIDFGTVILGQTSAVNTSVITAYNLTTGITATTTAPFEVSADGTVFTTTATVAQTGGTLYMRYTPTAAGAATGNVTLSSTGATNVTVALTGNGVDCSNSTVSTLPYTQDFEGGVFPPTCWSVENQDPDTTWEAFSYSGTWASCRGTSANRIEKLISVPFNFSTYTHTVLMDLTFMSNYSYVSDGTVDFKVYASTDGGTTWPTTPVWKLSDFGSFTNWTETDVTINLSSLAGQSNVRFAFVYDGRQCQVLFDDLSIYAYNEATILLSENAISFPSTPVNATADADVVVTAYNLTAGITATVAAPFAISTDGTAYGTTASIPQAGGTLYVRYAPTAAGTHTGTVTLTSGTATATIALNGVSVDCSNITLPINETFDNLSACWTYFAADPSNPNAFGPYTDGTLGNVFRFSSISSADDYTQYLITPMLPGNDAMLMTFDYTEYLSSSFGDETFMVGVSSTTNNPSAFTWGPEVTASETTNTYSYTLPAGTKYAAIKYTSEYVYYLYIDNVNITLLPTTPTFNITTNSLNFGTVVAGSTKDLTFPVTAYALANDITVTAAAPFSVSSNGTSFGTTATIAHDPVATQGTVYVRYAPTAPGNHTGNVTLTSGTLTHTVTVSGSAIDCSVPASLPFTEDFESDLTECWQNIDNDGDGYTWGQYSYNPYDGDYSYASASWVSGTVLNPDNWLITPTLAIPANGATLRWYVAAQDPDYPNDYYEVRISTNGTSLSNFTTVYSETLSTDQWEERSVNLPYAGQNVNIAFVHTNCSDVFVMKIDNISVTPGVGINEVEDNISIYPNPANNVLNVNASSNINKVEVYNMLGQNVMTVSVNNTNASINTSSLTQGMYMLKLHTDNGVVNQKFTVAR